MTAWHALVRTWQAWRHGRPAVHPEGATGPNRPLTRLDADRLSEVLDEAIHGLRRRAPDLAAGPTISPGQRRALVCLGVMVPAGLLVDARLTLVVLVGAAIAIYVLSLGFRLELLRRAVAGHPLVVVTDREAREAVDLPPYTVLVPLYGEPEVAASLLSALGAIDYPRELLDVIVLLEEDDQATIAAICAAPGDIDVTVLLVPVAEPRTKPKACNVGLQGARGELVTIFDAEDQPDPLQLRRAAVAFARDPGLACLQARLSYHNPGQNTLTRWFTAEYELWFTLLLPGLASMGAPIPLGGTSNHVRRSVLTEVGAWDPRNVTEDADLGVRLHRAGFRVDILDSVTLEEANSDGINWVKQRSRWYKGYLQTWLVHMRSPRRLQRELGWRPFLAFNLFVGGTPMLAMVNPVFWTLTVLWFVHHPPWIVTLFPTPVYYLGVLCFVGGNLAAVYSNLLAVRIAGRPSLAAATLVSPLYWLLMSAAAIKAAVQLVHAPTYWEKTAHGLDRGGERAHR